jgi:hypothetical protein
MRDSVESAALVTRRTGVGFPGTNLIALDLGRLLWHTNTGEASMNSTATARIETCHNVTAACYGLLCSVTATHAAAGGS